MRRRLLISLVALAASAVAAPAAAAMVLPPAVIDSGSGVIEIGGVAISEDGNGGLVYLRRGADNLPHVYASLYRGGAWTPPRRVDGAQAYTSFSPRIAAGSDGRLVVIWVQEGGVNGDRLYSASLDPGSDHFEAPVPIDLALGSGESATPDLAMNRAGQAYVVYRVVTGLPQDDSSIPPGYARISLRAARYNGSTWSRFDQQLNRNLLQPVRGPSADNAPKISIDRLGNGIVAFQEPDDEFIDRVWLRRLFGTLYGLPIVASPTTWDGAPLRGAADQIALRAGPYGNAAVSFRQHPGNPARFDGERVMLNLLPGVFAPAPLVPGGSRIVDSGPAGVKPINGSVAVNSAQQFASVFAHAGARRTTGGEAGDLKLSEFGPTAAGYSPFGGADVSEEGRVVSAWPAGDGVDQVVAINEAAVTGEEQLATVGAAGGEISRLALAGSGSGDAAIGAIQGSGDGVRILAVGVDAPPVNLSVESAEGWTRAKRPGFSWDPAHDAYGAIKYEVRVDRKLVLTTTSTSFRLARKSRDGRRRIGITAVDARGQRQAAPIALLRVDRKRPRVRIKRMGGNRVRVTITDGRRGRVSGLSARSRIRWGDGSRSRAKRRTTHSFAGGGSRRVVVTAFDRAGNKIVVARRI